MTLDCAVVLFAAFSAIGSATWLPPGLRGGIAPWGPAAPPAPPPWLAAQQSVVFRRPMDSMVDLTNDLGVAILQDYSHARSNFAFSPYGLASVLVVLYEGAHGESARQIHLAAKFPWDRDITRIGFRDIHRHLRSYFSHEGYLSGITLNKDSSTLKFDYKKVLRFYGYDVDIDNPKKPKPARPNGEKPMEQIPVLKPPESKPATSPPGGNTFKWTTRIPTTIGSEVTLNQSSSLVPKETDDGVTEQSVLVNLPEDTAATEQATKPAVSTESVTTNAPVSESSETSAVISEKATEVTDASATAAPNAVPSAIVDVSTSESTTKLPTSIMDNGMLIPDAPLLPVTPTTDQAIRSTPFTEAEMGDTSSAKPAELSTFTMNTLPSETTSTKDLSAQTSQNEILENSIESRGTTLEAGERLTTEKVKFSTEPENLAPEMVTDTQGRENVGIDAEVTTLPTTSAFSTTEVKNFEIDVRITDNKFAEKYTTSVTESLPLQTDSNFQETDNSISSSTVKEEELTKMTESTTVQAITPEELTTVTEASLAKSDPPKESTAFTNENSVETTEKTVDKNGSTENLGVTDFSTTPFSTEKTVVTTDVTSSSESTSTQTEIFGVVEETTDKTLVKRSPFPVLVNPLTPWHIKTLEEYLLLTDIGKKALQEPERQISPESGPLVPHTLDEFLIQKDLDWSNVEIHDDEMVLDEFVPKTLEEYLLTRQSKYMKNTSPILSFQTEMDFTHQSRFHRHPRTISDILHIPAVPDLSLQLQNGMFDSHVSRKAELYRPLPRQPFLVDGSIEMPVPVMTYSNVFPFAYIPRLHSQALEFPLDDERYKLLIILPMERRGLRQLIYDLSAVSLRGVMDSLRPSRIKATVPTFMVEGFVILTPALQRLGIWNVFDPRKANLSSMSSDPELYVRNVEQSVTVVIRNYVEILDIQTRTMAARGVEHEFIATHPFLYFVLDTETNVSLMAGQMLDPLNSRIY